MENQIENNTEAINYAIPHNKTLPNDVNKQIISKIEKLRDKTVV